MFGKKRRLFRPQIKPRRTGKIGNLLKKLLSLAILVFLIYLFFFSSYFLVSEIYIAEENIDNMALGEEIKAGAKKGIGKNIIFLDTDELNTKIFGSFPQLQNLQIEKDYPKSLKISFTEFPLAANVNNEAPNLKKSYIINSMGYAIEEDLKSTTLPTITIKSAEPLNTANPIIEAQKLNYILNAKTYFEEKFGMKVKEILYKPQAREVHLITEKNFAIWLDIQKSAEDQLKKLKKALVKLNIFNDPLLYIDLRIAGGNGDKIIYKRR
ncbi:hypothetical protein HY604_00960 [Candidatus Peregrinibacteria bacterium]|nr:hypothetical protein [Candidatus Peregrinibacteria bacterium]